MWYIQNILANSPDFSLRELGYKRAETTPESGHLGIPWHFGDIPVQS